MSRYNNISRSRSREKYQDFYSDKNRYNYKTKRKEEFEEMRREFKDNNFELEKLKEQKTVKEKQWDLERQIYLKRENDLLRELDRLKSQNSLYNKETTKKNYFQRNSFHKFYKPYYYNRNKFTTINQKSNFNDNPINKYNPFLSFNQKKNLDKENKNSSFKNTQHMSKSDLNELISNLEHGNNGSNKEIIEKQKFKKKIYLPNKQGINFVGLLIGPKGIFLRLLEKQSGCKIFINGKTISKREKYICPNDNDEAHVLVVGDSEEKFKRGVRLVEDIINADEDTRNKIISEQLKASKQEGFESLNFGIKKNELKSEDHLITHYGPPSKNARFYKVPDDCINSIIGNNGETIKKIERESKCKVQIAKAPIPNTKLRYIFIEGTEENYEIAKDLIERNIGEYAGKNFN